MSAATPRGPARGVKNELVVAPFRGLRFDPSSVPDLAAVTSPPYDVVSAAGARHLEALHPFNVVRLILPRDGEHAGPRRYEHAADTLAQWRTAGLLRRDADAAIYVYDQQREERSSRGILAAVALRAPMERVVLPHEDVMPEPVRDRLELMRATNANLEPILLAYEGGAATARVVDAAAQRPPLVEATTEDGVRHRLWGITDPSALRTIAADLVSRQALIADGHHRYATYLKLQAERHRAGDGAGPWDFGLALLVDNAAYPLDLQSISRVVEGLPLTTALRSASPLFRMTRPCTSLEEGRHLLQSAQARHPFLLTDGSTFTLLSDPEPTRVTETVGSPPVAGRPVFDATVLHTLLLAEVWRVPDSSGRIRYVHDVADALRSARETGGTAVLMRPVAMSDVVGVAARGERMPRKSTSFGPKPRTGFVLRLLDE